MTRDAYHHAVLPGKPGAPTVFAFHGTGGTEGQLLGFSRELFADAAVVAPRGDVSEGGALRFFRRTGEGVYDMADLARGTQKMAGFVAAHRERNSGPTIGIGYSNGANILASVLFARPDLFDEAILMHPLIPFEPQLGGSLAGKRILITAGRRDTICPPEQTVRLDAFLRQAGADVTLAWHDGGHEVNSIEIDAIRSFVAGVTTEAADV
jgi:phospholipase/carboxylesterase